MAKFKAYIKDGELLVKSKLGKNEAINVNDINIFQTKLVRGIMRPMPENDRKIIYSAPAGIPLSEYLPAGISTNDFFVAIAQIIEMSKKIESSMLNINNVVMDISYIYINTMTKEISFIYQPVLNVEIRSNIFNLMFDVANASRFLPGENLNEINEFVNTIMQMKMFNVTELENLIMRIHPNAYKQVKRQAGGKSQVFKETVAKPYDTGYGMSGGMSGDAAYRMNGNMPGNEVYGMNGSMNGSINAGYGNNPPDGDNDETMLFDEGGTALLGEEDDYESMATTLLSENKPECPYIIRRTTYERADIDKPIFKIGKEKRFVDFFVTNNSAVSRVHADIITKNGQYFIRDNNSTNKTFVNGSPIPVNVEVKINNGDIITLANDEFEFHID